MEEDDCRTAFLPNDSRENIDDAVTFQKSNRVALVEFANSDEAEYIDGAESERYPSSATSAELTIRKDNMAKTSPSADGATAVVDNGEAGRHHSQKGNSVTTIDISGDHIEEWRHSTLREVFPEALIVDRQMLVEKNTRTKTRFQVHVFNFLERPTGVKCFVYHMVVFAMVLVCLIFSVLSTVEPVNDRLTSMLLIMESCVVFFFAIEYCVRLWAAGSIGKYSGCRGRLRFAMKPICVIDLLAVIASTVVLLFSQNGNVFATSAIRGIRFLQILRMLHVDRQGGTWRLLGSVVYIHRQELITTLYIGFLALILSSYFVYLAEKPDGEVVESAIAITANATLQISSDNKFENYADALWWGVVTVTTIGYGDYVPKTWLGKVVASCFSIFAISFFALPAGILGSGFALKVQQKQRQKKFNRQIPAAANLIQACWRCYSTRRGSNCEATWNVYALPHRSRVNSTMSSAKQNHSKPSKKEHVRCRTAGAKQGVLNATSPTSWNEVIDEMITRKDSKPPVLPNSYKIVVRALRVLIFLVRKKEFHHCRQPYDVRDVFEQYSHGYVNITVRLKELQRRLDQTLGKPASFVDETDLGSGRQRGTAGCRLIRLEKKIHAIEDKMDEILRRLPLLDSSRAQEARGQKGNAAVWQREDNHSSSIRAKADNNSVRRRKNAVKDSLRSSNSCPSLQC